jgi:hypothetical protein
MFTVTTAFNYNFAKLNTYFFLKVCIKFTNQKNHYDD